ncbi:MAG: AMP-binding protein [Propionibacteriales bacterium]|nr:AMP-binding protein [Propionibacteriales bacterium]
MRVIDYFDKGARDNGARLFILSDEGNVTYAEAGRHSWQLAAGLYARGFSPGAGVGVLAANVNEALLGMLGLWRAGGVWAPLNHLNALSATIDFMNEVKLEWLLLHSRFADDVEEIRAGVPTLKHIVCLDKPFAGAEPMSDFLAAGAGVEVPDWSDPNGAADASCGTWPTGGTTGKSKAVVWTNGVVSDLIELCTRHWPACDHPVNLMLAPITHAAGVMAVILASQGATVVMRPGFDAEDALDCVERHGVTHLFLPPTAYYRMLEAQAARARDCSSLQMLLIAAAPVSPEKLGEGVRVFGPCVAQCWGQAEAPMLLTYLPPEEIAAAAAGDHPERLASCGRPTFSCQVEVMDEDGGILGSGQRGELVARGRLVTPGYLNRAEDTAAMRTFGWHHTGDVGYIDDDGFVYIVDRKKEMIITGGFNVFPAEVEAAIHALPEVRDCAVIGVPDDRWGEAVCAVVIPVDPTWADGDHIISASKAVLGSVKAPKVVHFVDALPSTPVGKVDKKALRATYWAGRSRSVN